MARLILLILFLPVYAHSQTIHPEKDYQNAWCAEHKGVTEYILEDRTRVDCLTDEYAVEVDFAKKWAEAAGQAMHYSRLTGKSPGVLFIITTPKDKKHVQRFKKSFYWIRVWTIGPGDL